MTSILRRYAVAFAKCLLPVISLILLTAQLTYQPPCCFHSLAPGASAWTQQPRRGDPGDLPGAHCHGKVYLSLDKRYDLKPLLFLPAVLFQLTAMPAPRVVQVDCFSSTLTAAITRPHCYRGPPVD